MNLNAVLEGLLFIAGEEGLSKEEIIDILQINDEKFDDIINKLYEINDDEDRGIKLNYLGNKYKLVTKKEHNEYFSKLIESTNVYKLTPAALEVLAIVAYHQPVTRAEIDELRGVFSSNVLRRLVSLDLITEDGRSDLPGRPYLYITTKAFLDYFNLGDIKDLPNIEEVTIEHEQDLFKS